MSTIWKFPLSVVDDQIITMPHGAVILAVQEQHGVPCVWAQVNPDQPASYRQFFMHGTGREVDPRAGQHIGTFQMFGGNLVFHVFEPRP